MERNVRVPARRGAGALEGTHIRERHSKKQLGIGSDEGAPSINVINATADTSGPLIESPSVTPSSVDVQSSSQQVTLTAHLSDPSGVDSASAQFRPDGLSQSVSTQLTLESGTPTDGTWKGTFEFPRGAAPGPWKGLIFASDTLRNNSAIGSDEGAPSINVINATADTSGPLIESPSVTPSSVDVQSSSQQVTLTAHLSDPSGVDSASAQFRPDGLSQSVSTQLTLESGTPTDGTWKGTFEFPRGAAPGP